MADNVAITAGSGTTIAADELTDGTLGSVKVQYVKIMDGTIDGSTKAAVSSGGLKVDISGTSANSTPINIAGTVTGNVSGTVTSNKGDTAYTKFTKYASLTATGETDVWAPNTGKKFVVTDIMTSAAAAGTFTLRDGTAGTVVLSDYYAANGGRTSNLQTPIQSATGNAHLTAQASATAMSVTVTGYEV